MAVADALRASGAEVSFLGTRERIEADLVPAAGYEIDFVKVRGIDRGSPLRAAKAAFEALLAVGTALRVLWRRRPDVVVGGGGFVAGPAGLAAVLARVPLVLTEADSHLGLANRLLARAARRVCLAFPIDGREGERYLVTGRPVPDAVLAADRGAARERFGIAAGARCLLVMGGSQGARSINECALAALAERAGRDFDVIHLAGKRDFEVLEERLAAAPHSRALHAARLRARPRRLPRRLRPRPGTLGRLDLRAHRGGAAGDPRALPARRRRSPGEQRRLDGRRRRRRDDPRRGA